MWRFKNKNVYFFYDTLFNAHIFTAWYKVVLYTTEINYVLNGNKVSLFHLDELSKYYFSRSFVAREIKNLEFISMK